MSSSSIRRIKERGGAGGKVTALRTSKNVTPVSSKGGGDVFKKSVGKENPRAASGILSASQKPAVRAMPRIEKPVPAACADAESRLRRSTLSVPRGRSSSPSEFTRALSDLRKRRAPRVSGERLEKALVCENGHLGSSGGKGLNGVRVLEKVQQKKASKDANAKVNEGALNGIGIFRDCNESAGFAVSSEKNVRDRRVSEFGSKSEGEKGVKDVGVKGGCKEEVKLSVDLGDVGEVSANGGVQGYEEGDNLDSNVEVGKLVEGNEECKEESCLVSKSVSAVGKVANGGDLGSKVFGESSLDKLKTMEGLKEKGVNGGSGVRVGNKYPSKLHEKLAFLEGKVKRIASDIKRTKEMLDMNNPDASKAVLSDIQDKISGIEKAMGHVMSNPDGNVDSVKNIENNDEQAKMIERSQTKQAEDVKNSVKGLNSEELEARLFPHHKLLKNRASMNTSLALSQNHKSLSLVPDCETKVEEKSLSSIDEIPIAMEFLASLNKEQSKVLDYSEVHEMDGATASEVQHSSDVLDVKYNAEIVLTTDEKIDEFDDQENRQAVLIDNGTEDTCSYQLNEIGRKTSTGGWFVSEGESVLLAHDDGSCSFYDIANCEEKAEYKPPPGISPNVWRDCWIIRAPGADGCSGRYVVAASAGNTMDSGFCSWDFYTKDVRAFHIEDGTTALRTVLSPLPNSTVYRRNPLSTMLPAENQQWWYKPCGPLIISAASSQKVARIYDIRDGEQIMKWEVQKPVLTMDYSSPLQWRNRGKVVIAEAEAITLCDVSSLNPQALLSIPSFGRKVSALHVNNTDAELGGGVRQRVSSLEAEGNDGVFCTPDSINIMDFRHPSGVGLKIPKLGVNAQSVFSRGDSIFLGCANLRSGGKKQLGSQVQQFSLRKQRLVSAYTLPESNAHSHYTAITQVWGNSNLVMGICGLGLFVFDALKDDGLQPLTIDYGNIQKVREIIGPDDLYSPSFDYSSSRVLLISRDRPALWRYLS
ncbi:KIN14B-interacting protein At4g14310 [Malania oleifera]|uniref:KIN14B-interacting protein At4g14310 n=1 Tax=Malania oleifera TaxID=397392 RepID=UPI0025ADE9CF|nr:KIN14B-interacting protein At4g14310 [Malania oleifera]